MDNPAAQDRSNGYERCMAESYPEMKVISKPFNWDAVICSQIVSTQVSTTQIDGVFAAAGYRSRTGEDRSQVAESVH